MNLSVLQLYSNLPSPFPEVEANIATDDIIQLALNHGLPIAMAASRYQWPEASLTNFQRRLSQVIEVKRRTAAELVGLTVCTLHEEVLQNCGAHIFNPFSYY